MQQPANNIDLFEISETLPQEVQDILIKWGANDDLSYQQIGEFLDEIEALGYTFDYYLDATPYNLRLLTV